MTSPSQEKSSSETNDGDRHVSPDEVSEHFSMPMEVFRELYKTEIHVLWREVEHFRLLCQRQMAKQKAVLIEHRIQCEEALAEQQRKYRRKHTEPDFLRDKFKIESRIEIAPDLPDDITRELRQLEENMTFLESRGPLEVSQLDVGNNSETLINETTDRTTTPPIHIEGNHNEVSYQADQILEEIDSEEGSKASRSSKEGETETDPSSKSSQDTLKEELRKSLIHLKSIDSEATSYDVPDETLNDTTANSKETSNKARKHWMIARKHLIDKMTLLEATVKRYRSELAAATTKITAKEMEVTQLNKQMSDLRSDIKKKDRKIDDLEDRLMKSLADKTKSERNLEMFMEELQNIELHTTIAIEDDQEMPQPPTKQQSSFKKKILRKQLSSMSFFGPSKDKNSKLNIGGAALGNDTGDITTEAESPQLKRRSSHPPILEDMNSNGNNDATTRQLINEILVTGRGTNKDEQTILKKHYGVDTSSRACVVM